MSPRHDLNDAKHWQDRAAKIRTLAGSMGQTNVTGLMFDLANDYEKLAVRAAERAKGIMVAPSPLRRFSPPKTRK